MSGSFSFAGHPSAPLEPCSVVFTIDAIGQLHVQDHDGRVFENVSPVRLFPLSRPRNWIAILDSQGRELLCLEDPSQLTERNRQILEQELTKREFVPLVKQVLWVSGNSEPCEWLVKTDRGQTRFILKDEADVRRLGENGVLIVDSFGIRYFVPDRNQLDKFSRRVIEWYV